MSWTIDPDTLAIIMHKGDTGGRYLKMKKKSQTDFEEGDVAIFEIWKGKTTRMMHREFPLDDDEGAGNGRFLLAFRNSDTDTWEAGTYQTEFRVSLNPIRSSGKVVDGDTVRTVKKSTLTINDVLIDI